MNPYGPDIYGIKPETFNKVLDVHSTLVNLIGEVYQTKTWSMVEREQFAQGLNEVDQKLMGLLSEYGRKQEERWKKALQI